MQSLVELMDVVHVEVEAREASEGVKMNSSRPPLVSRGQTAFSLLCWVGGKGSDYPSIEILCDRVLTKC